MAHCPHPVPFEELVDYLAGALPSDREEAVEAHFFECAQCTERLDGVDGLASGIAALIHAGLTGGSVTSEVVDRAAHAGLKIRRYTIDAGGSVACTAAPEDDFVVVELNGKFEPGEKATVDVEMDNLHDGSQSGQSTLDATIDRERGAIVLMVPGDVVRAYPKSRFTMHVTTTRANEARRFGAYVMNHTPWQELESVQ